MVSLFPESTRRKIERRAKLYESGESRGWIPYEYRLCGSPSPDSRETQRLRNRYWRIGTLVASIGEKEKKKRENKERKEGARSTKVVGAAINEQHNYERGKSDPARDRNTVTE